MSLFRKNRFMLDEMFERNASKICPILYIREPKVAFSVFHFVLLYFFHYECLGPRPLVYVVDIDQVRGENKACSMK